MEYTTTPSKNMFQPNLATLPKLKDLHVITKTNQNIYSHDNYLKTECMLLIIILIIMYILKKFKIYFVLNYYHLKGSSGLDPD